MVLIYNQMIIAKCFYGISRVSRVSRVGEVSRVLGLGLGLR